MPIINNYTYTVVDGDLTIPNLVGKPRPSYPFPDDSSIYTLDEDFMIFIDYYEPLIPATRHDEFNNIFYISDTPISDIGNGIGRYTRRWSSLPGFGNSNRLTYSRIKYESYAFQIPGIDTDVDLFVKYAASGSDDGTYITITTVGTHDIETSKLVTIYYHVIDPVNGQPTYKTIIRKAISASGTSVVVAHIRDDSGAVIVDSISRADVNQESRTRTVTSKLVMSYWLPGVNIDSVNSIPMNSRIEIIGSTGNITDKLSESTSPTLLEYTDWVAEKRWIQVEDSILREWNGLILEKTDRFIYAII
jgi:hypothetical protein